MRRTAALACAGLLLACETAPPPRANGPPPAPAVRTSGDDYRLPERAGEFTLQRFSDFAEPEAGFMAKYVGPDSAQLLDFFVYSARNAPAELSAGDLLWWEYEQTKHQVEASLEPAGWRAKLASEEMLRLDTKRGTVDAVAATYQGEGRRPLRSIALVALVGDDFVKMRATRVGAADEASERALADARRAFFAQLEPRAQPEEIRFETRIGVSVESDPACAVVVLALYGAMLEQALASGHTLHTLERESGLLAGVAEFLEQREGEPCADPALRDLQAVRAAGFVREYVWQHSRPSYWPDPGDLRSDAFEAFWREQLEGRPPLPRGSVRLRFAPETEPAPNGGAAAE
jgi:hypothetical protein